MTFAFNAYRFPVSSGAIQVWTCKLSRTLTHSDTNELEIIMRNLSMACFSLTMMLASQAAFAVDAKGLSSRCVSCHGAAGISSNPLYPNLAGQKSAYLLKQMRDFQKGTRKDPVMNAMVQGISEQDLDALAEYYSNM